MFVSLVTQVVCDDDLPQLNSRENLVFCKPSSSSSSPPPSSSTSSPSSPREKTWRFANRAPLLGTTLRGTLRCLRSIFILIEDIRWTSHVRYLKHWTLPILSSVKQIRRWLVTWRKKIPQLVDFPPPDRKSGLDLGDCFCVCSTPGILFIETPKILTTGGCLFEKPEKMSLQIQRMASEKLFHICCHHGGLFLTD